MDVGTDNVEALIKSVLYNLSYLKVYISLFNVPRV